MHTDFNIRSYCSVTLNLEWNVIIQRYVKKEETIY